MKLVRLEMKNFRQHVDTAIDFQDGVTGIIGPNGSGKTTILEAISWALYGAPAVRGNNDTIRSRAAEGGTKASVTLSFELGGSIYRVFRQIDGSGRSGSANLEIDGRALRSGMSEVSDSIAKLLGMDYRAFFTSFFTGQKQLEFMSAQDGRARALSISRMLGYDRIAKARDKANDDRKGLDREISGLEAGLPDPEELKARKREAEAALISSQDILKSAEKTLAEARAILDKLRPLKDASDQKAKRYEEITRHIELYTADLMREESRSKQLSRELGDFDSSKEEFEKLKARIDECRPIAEEYKQLKALQAHEGDRQRIQGEIARVEPELKRIRAKMASLGDAKESQLKLETALAQGERLLAESEEKLCIIRENRVSAAHGMDVTAKQLQTARTQILEKRNRIEAAGAEGACPTCERPLTDELPTVLANFDSQIYEIDKQISDIISDKARLESAGSELEAAQNARDALGIQVQKLRDEKCDADIKVSELRNLDTDLRRYEKELGALNEALKALPSGFDAARFTELDKIKEELKPVSERAAALKAVLEREPSVRSEFEELVKTMKTKQADIGASRAAVDELGFSRESHTELMDSFEQGNGQVNAAALRAEQVKGDVKASEILLENIKREQMSYNERVGDLKSKREERLRLKTLAEALDKFQADMNDRIRPELESIAGELLTTMTDGRYNSLEIDEGYKGRIRDDGELKEVISGGEDDLVNLSLRLAVSEMIAERAGQSFSLLVLDEVFGALDDTRRENVVMLLQNLKNRFEQIILITHIKGIRDMVDNTLWVEFDERTKTSRLADRSDQIDQIEAGVLT